MLVHQVMNANMVGVVSVLAVAEETYRAALLENDTLQQLLHNMIF